MHLLHRDLVFERRNKLYVADFWDILMMDRKACMTYMCGQKEMEKAKQVHDLIRNSGYPSLLETIHIIQDGNMTNMAI
jgi:hypothetical protein